MGEDMLKEIKRMVEDNDTPLDEGLALRLMISFQIDLIEKNNEDAKEQKKINDKVDKMFTVYLFNAWMLAALGASVISLIVSLVTGQASIVIAR